MDHIFKYQKLTRAYDNQWIVHLHFDPIYERNLVRIDTEVMSRVVCETNRVTLELSPPN
jgi:hypothetical protein